MSLYTSLTGLLIVLLLLIFTRKAGRANYYLAGYLFLVSFYAMVHYVVMYSKSMFWTAVCFVNFTPLFLLAGPLLLLYTRSILTARTGISKKDLLHGIPALLCLITVLPWILTDFNTKEVLAVHIINDPGQILLSDVCQPFFPHIFSYVFRSVIGICYVGYCIFLIYRYYCSNNMSDPRQHNAVTWLLLFTVFQMLLYIVYLVNILVAYQLSIDNLIISWDGIFYVSQGVALVLHNFILFVFPVFLYRIPGAFLQEQSLPPIKTITIHRPGYGRD